ncbi:site-specific DNA-methyltransferase [Xanthomonas translucens]|uniref:site-specific DNA-methyltransferase n=2 Tax=Xanthomonas campestris pv. translucens TaxID=343 RepID=UPI000345D6CF|nr:site-specific DNA-methyltransferase [Xanthomonas translucens]MCT8272506.1 site-specific DNA-methyltransferase [Xanthomonas translucens pv. undulosa]MCT8281688.1 site-specific DNA-methyltransferase [Xanthomonas translucens pv. undulosa]MCT8316379.1 site-specific DNA-methyltransferase [Xanthomonas translucens pv. undulosa]WLA15698.1 site-specific DNA-methyltransferase [Xanthomonas translucens]WNJ32463.1 site-specific DNA-methyltransferase [Xanthomonas translucens pv. undulosa]
MIRKQKLELTWVGKDERPRLEPRILLEDAALSYHATHRVGDADRFDNLLIHGDNLLALKALEQEFRGQVKCIFIDPPYNTGSAFTHYDDGVEHSLWLSMMRDRLEILRNLLRPDGSIWITIDDNEAHYLKVLGDEVFCRGSFVTSFIWRKVDSPNDNKVAVTPDHEYVLCFAKDQTKLAFKQRFDASILDAYRAPDEHSVRPYRDRLLKKNGKNSLRSDRPSMFFGVPSPDGNEVFPLHDDGREARWAVGKTEVFRLLDRDEIVWKMREKNGESVWVPYTREFAPETPSRPWPTIWSDLHTTRQTKAHQREIFGSEMAAFETPKPEDMLERILQITTNPGDLVLDSFAGSGTTGAVAHKMGRRWIMVELGEHCHTHIVPRLRKVIDGEDPGGVTASTGWKGGGGFRYYRLAPSLLSEDAFGNRIINPEYRPEMLAEAVCKLMGYTYAPSEQHYWQHGRASEQDFLYVTTASLSHAQLRALSAEVGPERTLLVCCKAFRSNADAFDNLTIQKIPQTVLDRCEWGRDDYSLRIADLPPMPEQEPPPLARGRRGTSSGVVGPSDLFGDDGA